MGYGMTRRSASRGILYSAPPNTAENGTEEDTETAADTEAAVSEPAAADD